MAFTLNLTNKHIDPSLPEGLRLYYDAITWTQESALLEEIDSLEWNTTLKRRVQHYGVYYDYARKSRGHPAPDMPTTIYSVAEKLHTVGIFEKIPDQAIVNEYTRKQGIAAHIDKNVFGPTIAGLNLGDECIMNFTHPNYGGREIYLPSRSLLIMSGVARSEWKHGISQNVTYWINDREKRIRDANYRRVSITFRTML